MSEYLINGEKLGNIADAIRERLNESDGIEIDEMPEKISNIEKYEEAMYLEEVVCDKSILLNNAILGKKISRINVYLDRQVAEGTQTPVNISITMGNLFPPELVEDYVENGAYTFRDAESIPISLPEGKYYVGAKVCGNNDFAYQIEYETGAVETVIGAFDTFGYTPVGHITNGSKIKSIIFTGVAVKDVCIFAGDTAREYMAYSEPQTVNVSGSYSKDSPIPLSPQLYNFQLTDSSILVASNERLKIKYYVHQYNSDFVNGCELGKALLYNQFWDVYQDNGFRTSYGSAFSTFWTDETFRPKYDIMPTSANYMFLRAKISNFDEAKSRGVKIDFSYCTDCEGIFSRSEIETISSLDFSKAVNLYYTFSGCPKIKEIGRMKVKETTLFKDTFNACSKLEKLIINGTIGQNGFNVSWSKLLTHESLLSILNALKNQPDIESPKCTLGATNLAKLSSEEISIATDKGWTLA